MVRGEDSRIIFDLITTCFRQIKSAFVSRTLFVILSGSFKLKVSSFLFDSRRKFWGLLRSWSREADAVVYNIHVSDKLSEIRLFWLSSLWRWRFRCSFSDLISFWCSVIKYTYYKRGQWSVDLTGICILTNLYISHLFGYYETSKVFDGAWDGLTEQSDYCS